MRLGFVQQAGATKMSFCEFISMTLSFKIRHVKMESSLKLNVLKLVCGLTIQSIKLTCFQHLIHFFHMLAVQSLLANSVCQTLQLTTKRYEFLLDYFSGCLSSLLEFVKQLSLRLVFTKLLTIILRSFLKVKWCFSYKKLQSQLTFVIRQDISTEMMILRIS